MTKQQEQIVEILKQKIFELDAHGENYEFKRWEITEEPETVWITSEVGMKGDEGTAAEVYARTYRHIGIGKRGGVFAGKKGKGWAGKHVWIKGMMNVLLNCANR